MQKLPDILSNWDGLDINICLERHENSQPISSISYRDGAAFMIGSEGGFDNQEIQLILSHNNINIIDLGDTILRAETAAISCLSYVKLSLL